MKNGSGDAAGNNKENKMHRFLSPERHREKLMTLLTENNKTVSDLADILGITNETAQNWARRDKLPMIPIEYYCLISKVFGVPMEYFCEDELSDEIETAKLTSKAQKIYKWLTEVEEE